MRKTWARVLYAALAGCPLTTFAADAGQTSFNPSISVVLMGHAYHDNRDGKVPALIDSTTVFPAADNEASTRNGFNLDGSELSFASNVDSYFNVWLAATYEDDGVDVEEAWLQTKALPAGLQLKAGRLLSGIGYQNTRHQHDWDFIDQNLAYQALFHGEHLNGDGMQLTWLLPTDSYWLLGVEALQGDGLNGFGQSLDAATLSASLGVPASALGLHQPSGPNLFTAFMHFAPDLGTRQALQLGLSAAAHRNQQDQFLQAGNHLLTEGPAGLAGAQAVYKRFATDGYGTHGLTLTAEYFFAWSDQQTRYSDVPVTDDQVQQRQQAGYVQAVYGLAPRWQLGLRHAVAGVGNSRLQLDAQHTPLHSSRQSSLEFTWHASEFSQLRFEFSRLRLHDPDNQRSTQANQFMLGYVMIIGAHPAHAF